MSANLSSLDSVGKLDQFIGIIPTLSAFNIVLEQKSIDMNNYVYELRRLVTMEKILFGKHSTSNTIKICNNKTAEYNLFGQITFDDRSEIGLKEILDKLKQDQFILNAKPDAQGCFDVNRNNSSSNSELLDGMSDLINSKTDLNFILEQDIHQKSFIHFSEKIILTINLLKELQNKNLLIDLNKKIFSVGCKYENKLNLPMVGSMKGHPSTPVIYILSFFESNQDSFRPQEVDLQMNIVVDFFLKNDSFRNLVKKTAYLGGIIDNCFVRKILFTSEKDKNLYVLYCIVFKNDLFLNASNDFMINLKQNVEKNLKWNAVYHMGEFILNPLI